MTLIPTAELLALKEQMTPGRWTTAETTIHGTRYGGMWVEGESRPDDDGELRPPLIQITGSGGSRSFTTRIVDRQDHDDNDANARAIAHLPDLIDEALALRALLEQAEAALEKAANRLDWCAGLIVDDAARDRAGDWGDDARTTLEALRQHREASHG